MKYRVFEPGRGVVSWHRKLEAAKAALVWHLFHWHQQGVSLSASVQRFDGREWINVQGVAE